MNLFRNAIFLATCLVTGVASAQNPGGPALNLKLPPSDLPIAASTAASPAATRPLTNRSGNPTSAPGVYYGDTSGRTARQDERVAAQRCDDSTYNQPQVHGSASMGVMGGNHVSGSYEAGTIHVTRNLGDCEHPSGGIGVSISVGQGQFHGRRW
ncbi:MAG TPA: hypothetical protein VJ862_04405 [Rhodanobacteraceae bacterium]|nr:hypothetical protein [Rhodanobacteraceae bacterium]